jgi:hypothetical protein
MPRTRKCEGFSLCGVLVPADESELRLRAMGWHTWENKWLCPQCLKKQRLVRKDELDGQEVLF